MRNYVQEAKWQCVWCGYEMDFRYIGQKHVEHCSNVCKQRDRKYEMRRKEMAARKVQRK